MYLVSIILSMILGYALLMMGPLIGGLIAFGIVVGSLFRGLYLLNEIHKKLGAGEPDRVRKAYEEYVKERDTPGGGTYSE